ncbi:MAG TPA: MFS transporter [Acidimicrobiales bacterium]|jgi:EmrB/QacA subfamily drug resistance transporter|nr:MFS transporter [Acidimicrobiales bacterium]
MLTRTGSAEERQADTRRWLVLGVMCLSLLLIVMDNTIVNVALPTLQRDLDASTTQLQWVVDAYILVFAGLLLTMGSLGDRFGRRGALAIGLSVMGTASILSSFANSADQLIATRALMGVGGAMIMPATLSIITNVFTDRRERAQAIAIWSATAGAAVAIGPVTGGWLLEHFWWGSVFLVNVPVVVVALVLGQLFVPTSRDPSAPPIDVPGALLSIAGLVVLVWAIIEGPGGWTDPEILGAFALSAVLLGIFVLWERRVPFPMLDVSFFRNPRFSAASGAIMLTFFAMFGSLFLLTQFLQSILGYTPLEAGIRLLPMAGVMLVISPLSAKLVERIGSKIVVATGLSVGAVGLIIASRLTAGASYPEVLASLVVLAAGLALVMPPATESIMGSLPLAKAGVGSAVNDTTRQVGGALGVAVLGSVMSSTYGPRVSDAISGLPVSSEQATAIHDQLGAALRAASEIGGEPGRMLADAASSGFADGMSTAFIIGAAALALGAVIVALFLPARARDHEPAAAVAAGGGQGTGTPAVAAGDGHRAAAPATRAVPSVPGDTLGWEPTHRGTGAPPLPAPAPDPEPR